jgi:hypothetical protein
MRPDALRRDLQRKQKEQAGNRRKREVKERERQNEGD